ncbi:hypothetical protein PCASD_13578 [Puccinia coronata f. sp. avenae]|uniref:Uncharacterized protein n=1 Tax=Puccinia coronata f. sp. avenae TaxID=200324 RepID=A0A2N5TDW8_9BASI|nr:hypothetical protein PCASD_13578 [Puccinia coronata f. sp. avenae]
MLSTALRPIGGKDNLPKRHTAWPNLQPQNIEAARGSNPHQKHQAAGLGFLLTHFARNDLGSNAAIGAPLLCPCTDTETEDGPGAELLPTPGRSYVAPSRPVAALGRYQAACARLSSGPACDNSGYRRITVAHPFRPGDPWRRRGGMGTGSGTVSQVAPLVRFTQSCDQAGTAASSGRALSWEIIPLCMYVHGLAQQVKVVSAICVYESFVPAILLPSYGLMESKSRLLNLHDDCKPESFHRRRNDFPGNRHHDCGGHAAWTVWSVRRHMSSPAVARTASSNNLTLKGVTEAPAGRQVI